MIIYYLFAIVIIFILYFILKRYPSYKTIRYTDGGHYFQRFLHPILTNKYKLKQTTDKDVDILIFSVFGNQHEHINARKKILICGEPTTISLNLANKAHIIIDCKLIHVPKISQTPVIYIPFYVSSFGERYNHKPYHLIKKQDKITKTKFCAFMYSHDSPERVEFFNILNKLKRVDAIGKSCNNVKTNFDRHINTDKQTYNDIAVDKYKPYKFVICFENDHKPGYITEKIISAMLANCIPIYWGASEITEHFNPKSFIHVRDFKSFKDCANYVLQVDKDDTLYENITTQSWFKSNILPPYFDQNYIFKYL